MIEQSWSTPQFGNVKYYDGSNIVEKAVAIFSAGYDTGKDTRALGTDDDKGRGVFIVDVTTGNLIWSLLGGTGTNSATVRYDSNLLDSMPASPKVADVDEDGFLDRIYIPDTGGKLWRIDLYNLDSERKDTLGLPDTDDSRLDWSVHLVANLGRHESNTLVDDRRFFNQVDYVQTRDDTGNFDALIISSGHRNNPNEQDINNRMYMIKDNNINSYKFQASACPTSGSPPIQDDPACKVNPVVKTNLGGGSTAALTDVTSSALSAASTNGWRLNLYDASATSRKKTLGSSVTINGVIYMTAFKPTVDTNQCTLSSGTSYVYQLDLHSSGGVSDLDGDGDIDINDRIAVIKLVGLPTTPGLHFGDDDNINVIPNDVFGGEGEAYTKVFYWFRGSD